MLLDGSRLLLTKLAPPPVRSDCIRRERLFELLDTAIARRLALVATPAGFGKTTLLGSWYATHQDSTASERAPVLAWLTLEPDDDDPARFWMYVLRALQRAHAGSADHPLLDLDVSPLASTETFLTALLNAFSDPRGAPTPTSPRETVLILDEYHEIANQEIHSAMAFLLEHLPASLHLLIASRTHPPLPLTRLRASGYLAELDTEAVSFSAEETAQFLQGTAPLAFTADEIARLQEQTGGWIMPLHLAALAYQNGHGSPDFIASLRGDHHAIVEYLAGEVFSRQPAEIQRFLLATSLLEECSGPLCDAMLRQTNSHSLLQKLERDHLFLFPIEKTHRWYRYHGLFKGFLQDRLRQTDSEMVREWHSRAADWYLQQEPSAPDALSRALPHLLAIQAWERAADLIEAASPRMLWQSGEVITLRQWIRELPQPILSGHPRLVLASAWAATLTGQFDAAETTLDTLERFLTENRWQASGLGEEPLYGQVAGEILAIRARIASFHDVERASILSRQALKRLPGQTSVIPADLLLNLGYAHLRSHDFAAASRTFQDARRIGRRSGNERAFMLASRYLAGAYETRGLLGEAAIVYRQALRLATSDGPTPPLAAGTVYIGNALLLYERDAVASALDQAERGLALGRRSGEMKTLFPGYLALAQIHQGLGDEAQAWQALEEAERLADFHWFSWTEAAVAAARVRLHLAEGQVDLAVRALSKDGWQAAAKQSVPFSVCPPDIQLVWARILLAQRCPEAAGALLQRVLAEYRRERPQASALPVVTLYSLALAAGGATEEALSLLADALPPALAQGYVRTFVDEGAPMAALLRRLLRNGSVPGVEALLDAFPTPRETRPLPGASFLSELAISAREVEVMRLLAAGRSNQQIADELVVALSTVRTHTKHIYRKLGVQGRLRAVARATALHLL